MGLCGWYKMEENYNSFCFQQQVILWSLQQLFLSLLLNRYYNKHILSGVNQFKIFIFQNEILCWFWVHYKVIATELKEITNLFFNDENINDIIIIYIFFL